MIQLLLASQPIHFDEEELLHAPVIHGLRMALSLVITHHFQAQ